MNHRELVGSVSLRLGLKKCIVDDVLSNVVTVMSDALIVGKTVTVSGVGTFSVQKRKPRIARNPRTGATIRVAAKKLPVLKISSTLKNAVL